MYNLPRTVITKIILGFSNAYIITFEKNKIIIIIILEKYMYIEENILYSGWKLNFLILISLQSVMYFMFYVKQFLRVLNVFYDNEQNIKRWTFTFR